MKRLAYGAVLMLLLVGAFVLWWNFSLTPVSSSDKSIKNFVVEKGDGVKEVAIRLEDAHLIRSKISFFLLERFFVKDPLQAGNFSLSPSMAATEIADKLTLGTEDIWITIPEGWRSEQIVYYLRQQGLSEPVGLWSEEGKYFPETYKIPKSITIDGVRKLMRQTFDQKEIGVSNDKLILASLVEREAKNSADRPIIAGILLNRLEAGMALDVDATIQYALGYWKQDLTLEDLKIKSPYNTYTNVGLPPGPICNPGIASINAALNPAKTDYLFYLTGKDGLMHYAKTNAEHNANVDKYL